MQLSLAHLQENQTPQEAALDQLVALFGQANETLLLHPGL